MSNIYFVDKAEKKKIDKLIAWREADKRYARAHPERIKAKTKKDYEAKKARFLEMGLCVRCGKAPAVAGIQYCEACRKYNSDRLKQDNKRVRERNRQKRAYLHEQGLCVHCGKNPARIGKYNKTLSTCRECADKLEKDRKELRALRIKYGVCTQCGKAPAKEGILTCFECALKRNEKERLRAQRKATGEKCPRHFEGEELYAGEPTPEKCLHCKIPSAYCIGENCVEAFRTWKKKEWKDGRL